MKIRIKKASDLGPVIREVRKAQKLRQDDAAGSIGVSENFLGKVERGSETVQWGKLFAVLSDLGLRLEVDIPDHLARNIAIPETADVITSRTS
jgi:transcriptional regulator with XRE-family HTH domain